MVQVTITSINNFSDVLALGCGRPSVLSACAFSKDQVSLGAGTVETVNLTIDTRSPLTEGGQAQVRDMSNHALACSLPFGIFTGLLLWGCRKNKRALSGLFMLLIVGATMMVSGCSGLLGKSAAAGTYTLQVTGVGSMTGVTQSAPTMVTVTQ
jgi:hypothetical protein